jgi:hypothetical protein
MTPHEIQKKLGIGRLNPFGLCWTMARLTKYAIPNYLLLGKRSAVIGLTGNPADTIYDRYITVALLHITRLEPLDAATASG